MLMFSSGSGKSGRTLTGTNANFFALRPAPMQRYRSVPVQKPVTSGKVIPVLCMSVQDQVSKLVCRQQLVR